VFQNVIVLFSGITISASVLTILALSLERFLIIRHPVLSRRIASQKRHVLLTIVLIWIISCGVMLPILIVRGITIHPMSTEEKTILYCHEQWTSMQHRQAFDIFLFIFIYIVPGGVVVSLHSASGCHLISGSQVLHRQGSVPHGEKVVASRRRVARMLLLLALLFAASWMPYHIVILYMDFTPSAHHHVLPLSLSLLLGHSNSSQNPLIYCLMNTSFRNGMKDLLSCRKPAAQYQARVCLL
jgi:hypothetical protein